MKCLVLLQEEQNSADHGSSGDRERTMEENGNMRLYLGIFRIGMAFGGYTI